MAARGIAAVFAVLAAFVLGCCAWLVVGRACHAYASTDRVVSRIDDAGRLRRFLMRGIPVLRPAAARVAHQRHIARFLQRCVSVLAARGYASDPETLAGLALAATAVLLVIGWVVGGTPAAGIVVAACPIAALSALVGHADDKATEAIRASVPDALRAMSVCFRAGFTLQQTFDRLRDDMSGPLATLFGRAATALHTGATVDEALSVLRSDSRIPELSFVAVALSIRHRCGGSMQTVLDAACESLEGELELQRSLRVHTAQAKLSARVVSLVTVGLVAVLCLLDKGFLEPFFSGPIGVALLAVAVVMQVAGVLLVRRMLDVEVRR